MDTNEHIHASYLISQGFIPYRDFFEHHHPLLWYLLLPVTYIFDRDINIVYVCRLIAVFGYLYFLYIFYKLSLKYTNNIGAQISTIFLLSCPGLWYDVQTLRPDIFMYICILAAVLMFFNFLDSHKIKYLYFSYLLWFIAFLFLQKAAIAGVGFIIINILLVLYKKIKISDIMQASVFPFILGSVLLFILYKTQTLSSWWLYNFTFNGYLQTYYSSYSTALFFLPIWSFILTLLVIRTYQISDKGNVLFCIWGGVLFSLLLFAPHPQYYFLYLPLSILLLSPTLMRLFNKHFLPFMVFLTFFIISSFTSNYYSYNSKTKLLDKIDLMRDIIENTTPNDKIQSYPHLYNLFNLDIGYYWFGFNNVVIISDLYTDKGFDFNEQIKKHKPKYITLSSSAMDNLSYHNSRWVRQRNTLLLQKASKGDKTALSKLANITIDYWQINKDYIQQHYNLVHSYGDIDLWERIDD